MSEEVKLAFGGYMGAYYSSLVPRTKSMQEYITRGLATSIVWAPSRMVDLAEEMLASWQRNDTDGTATHPAKMPVILVAMAKDYTPTGRDYARQIADEVEVVFPEDEKERCFKVDVSLGDIRTQVAFCAHDEPTARELARQFTKYVDKTNSRRFEAIYKFAGINHAFPVQIESPEIISVSTQTDSKNLTILACDLTLRAAIPTFYAPGDDDPNDGKGTDGDPDDPSGYQVVIQVNNEEEDVL
ncbi:MAG: hypothetical protein IPP22_08655 [Nitrosomonas sp.]|nr:hypothetical protein [Nitrosomonas sp.]